MIEVFKTNVPDAEQSHHVMQQLIHHFPASKINFDLDDCDRILRIEGTAICPKTVVSIVNSCNYQCEPLL